LPVLNEDDLEPGELLLAWTRAADADAGIEEVARRYHQRPARRLELPALGWSLAVYKLSSNRDAADLRLRLLHLHPQWLADFNTRYQAMAKPKQYARTQVRAPATTRVGAGSGVRIGILDGPVAAGSALAHRRVVTRSFLRADDEPAQTGHASAIAALIAGWDRSSGFAGVAPAADLSLGVVLRRRGNGADTALSAVIEGLDWLLTEKVQVINLSLGGPPNRLLAAAVIAAMRKSVVVVAAAGNDGPGADPSYPAAYHGVVAVTATDSRDRIYPRANQGSYLLVSAPGVDVWAPDGAAGHYATGTSFAAAIVTGAVAVLLQRQPQLSPAAVYQHLCRTAKDLGDHGRDPVFGCGLLQMTDVR
jgi:subtilisin family serine protease